VEPVNEPVQPEEPEEHADDGGTLPRYEKPVIRRYDQIDQVRPYGPSEV
jgi:hypothetical protein